MNTKKMCINAMGSALFVVLTLCLQVPVFENYYLCLGYIVMAFYTYFLGTASGVLVGTIGVLLYCLLTNGLRGMPGWILGNVVIGIMCGIVTSYANNKKKSIKRMMIAVSVIMSTGIGILGVKSLVEVFLYSLPFKERIVNNIYAFVADIIVLIIGFEMCVSGERTWRKVIEDYYE